MKKLTKEVANEMMDKLHVMSKSEPEPVTIDIRIILEGSQARFYRILHELHEALEIPENEMDPIIFADGISETFKKLWAAFSLSAMQQMMLEDNKEKNQKGN